MNRTTTQDLVALTLVWFTLVETSSVVSRVLRHNLGLLELKQTASDLLIERNYNRISWYDFSYANNLLVWIFGFYDCSLRRTL